MRWKQVDPYWATSDTGYRVSKAGPAPVYSAWAPPGKPLTDCTTADGYRLLGTAKSFEAAKLLCEAHTKA